MKSIETLIKESTERLGFARSPIGRHELQAFLVFDDVLKNIEQVRFTDNKHRQIIAAMLTQAAFSSPE